MQNQSNPDKQANDGSNSAGDPATDSATDHAAVRFPPPLLFLIVGACGAVLQVIWPLGLGVSPAFKALGIAITLFGLTVAILVFATFKRSSTAIEPWKPTTSLITSGFYAWSRNPIYVGFCLFNIGIGIAFNSVWIVLSFIPGAVLVYYIAIAREEAYLERKFGEEYLAYQRRVRRWF
jgi:protein-S-isoprenylcysteine O-methyltransferase Ste14